MNSCVYSAYLTVDLTIHVAPPDFIPYKALFLFVYKQTLNKLLAEQRIHVQYVYVITKDKVNKRVLEQKVPYMYMCVVKIIKIIKIILFNSSTISQGIGEEVDSLQSTTQDQTLETDTVIRGNETQTSRQWRDLVTPQLPLDMSSAGHLSRSSAAERSLTTNDIIISCICENPMDTVIAKV